MKNNYLSILLLSICFSLFTFGQNNALKISNDAYFGCNQTSGAGVAYNFNSNNFTIEYDFYLNTPTNYNARFSSFAENGDVAKPIHFYVNNTGTSTLLLGNGSTVESIPGIPSFNQQQWYHVAFVVNNNATKNITIYVNGVVVVNYNFSVTLDGFLGTVKMNLGAVGIASATNVGNSKFDNLRIWSTARTASEIASNYNSCLTGNETGLTSLFNFDGYNGRFIKNFAVNSIPSKEFLIQNGYSYVSGGGCTVSPLFPPITTTGDVNAIFIMQDN